jgi:MFS family permease
MGAFLIGSIIFQMPIAYISDRMDRRKMIICLGITSMVMTVGLYLAQGAPPWVLFLAIGALGAFSLPIYGQCISHVNDHLLSRQFVAASGTLLLLNGAGAAFGPIIVTAFMQFMGADGFILILFIIFAFISSFGIYRSYRSEPVPIADQNDTILMPARGSAVSIYNEET